MMLTGTRRRLSSWAVAVGLGLMVAACGNSTSTSNSSTIKIGILTTCGGPFAAFEQESFSGAKYALIQSAGGKSQGASPQNGVSGASVSGHPIEISFGCSDATPDKALAEARRLIQNVGVDILLGPLSGDEGIAIANYAKQQPNKTFVNGTSGAQQTTLSVKAPNFFRFGGDGAQWMAGLGTYAYPATPKGSLAGSLFTGLYYDGMTAIIQGLKQVGADLSGNQSKFQQALSGLTLSSPNGSIKLDSNRNAILPNYIVEIVSQSDGSLGFKTIKTVPNVNQTFNGFFGPSSSPSRDSPSC